MNTSNNIDTIVIQLRELGLTSEQAKLYIELLKEPATHLRLAHATGINRTKVYRIIDDLEKRSLVTRRTDDRGSFLVAADPSTLEVELVSKEESLKSQRVAFNSLLPTLQQIKANEASGFIVQTYEGAEGFKQMLWHELKAEGENLIFGSGTIEDLVPDGRWAEKHRAQTVDANYLIRELINPGEKDKPFTLNEAFMDRYTYRNIEVDILLLKNQISIYNNTVATYHWRNDQKVGVEVINDNYAAMMRQLFENYWQIAHKTITT
jgi:sugar-specific transcriptional regulator TrmB